MASTIKNKDSIALGIGKLFLGDSVTNIATFGQAFSDADYFGSTVQIGLKIEKTYIEKFSSKLDYMTQLDLLLASAKFSVNITFLEMSQKNLGIAFGGDGTSTNILNDIFGGDTTLRLELVFTYPNKTNQMILILPKTKVVPDSVELDFLEEEAWRLPITFQALNTENAAWAGHEFGRIIFT
ncbi:MAG: hypothetical protein B7C24_16600 [Bacteroidetes bacterium 4572_77]|nr:MAG: hypothetical protein B7C24_16600 [Bacteroidetes bacterium 4572_77]